MKPYTIKSGAIQYMQSFAELERAAGQGDAGFCLACGAEAEGIEPDARKYECESCGAPKVYGAEELILMGLYYGE